MRLTLILTDLVAASLSTFSVNNLDPIKRRSIILKGLHFHYAGQGMIYIPTDHNMIQRSVLTQLVGEINLLTESGLDAIVSDDRLRRSAIDAARRLTLLVQSPEDAIRSLAFSVRPSRSFNLAVTD